MPERLAAVIAFVQDDSDGANNGSTTIAVTFGTNCTAGNLICLHVGWDDAASVTGVADSQSNTYTQAFTQAAGDDHVDHWYAFNITGGANTVTVTFSSSAAFRRLIIHEYSGVQTSSDPLDVTSSNTATEANGVSGSATTTAANNLIFGGIRLFGNATTTAGTGYTLRIQEQNGRTSSEDILDAGAAGSEEVAFVHASVEYICGMSTFFIAAPVGGPPAGLRTLALTGVGI